VCLRILANLGFQPFLGIPVNPEVHLSLANLEILQILVLRYLPGSLEVLVDLYFLHRHQSFL
jgi:hypothetical protein